MFKLGQSRIAVRVWDFCSFELQPRSAKLGWHLNLGEFEAIHVLLVAYLVQELPCVLDVVAHSPALHRLDEPELVTF